MENHVSLFLPECLYVHNYRAQPRHNWYQNRLIIKLCLDGSIALEALFMNNSSTKNRKHLIQMHNYEEIDICFFQRTVIILTDDCFFVKRKSLRKAPVREAAVTDRWAG